MKIINKKGFTLIELLAVIVILAVIMVIAVPQILDVISSSRKSVWESDIKIIKDTIELNTNISKLQVAGTFTVANVCSACSTGNDCKTSDLFKKIDISSNDIQVSCVSSNSVYTFTVTPTSGGQFAGQETKTITCNASGSCNISGQKSSDVTAKVCSVTSGTGTQVGDMITCGTEKFYVIKNDGSTINMLSQYNVDTTTNLQSTNANTVAYGTSSDYNTSYIKVYVDNYTEYLKNTIGVKSASGRLITKEEMNDPSIGCDSSKWTCSSAPSFIRTPLFWTSSPVDSSSVWSTGDYGGFGSCVSISGFGWGVRPLVTISVNEI